jgi:hypothetical protein
LPQTQPAAHLAGVTQSRHPNREPFEGILTRLDVASDKPPSGSRNHRVILTRAAAEEALPTLLDMAVGFKTEWDGHDARQKCGIIKEAWIEGNALWVRGFVYARDFSDVIAEMRRPGAQLGMSFEMCDAHVADMREKFWRLTRVTFTGAAILLRHKAAYTDTTFALTAEGERFTGKLVFAPEGEVVLGIQKGRRKS